MGGAQSEVSARQQAVIVESAVFDPVSVRRTAFRYGLRSEASLRFEKGQESRLARIGADRTAQLLAQWAGGRVAVGVVDTNPIDEEPRRVGFRPARVDRLLGTHLGARGDAGRAGAHRDRHRARARAASWSRSCRPTARHRHRGGCGRGGHPPARLRHSRRRLPDTVMPAYRDDPRRLTDFTARHARRARPDRGRHQRPHRAPGSRRAGPRPTIRRRSASRTRSRSTTRSCAARCCPAWSASSARNERQRWPDVAIFEIGAVHEWADGAPRQQEVLALLMAGELRPASWSEPGRGASVDDAQGHRRGRSPRASTSGRSTYRPDEGPRRRRAPGPDGRGQGRRWQCSAASASCTPPSLLATTSAPNTLPSPRSTLTRCAAWRTASPRSRNVYALPAVERDIAVVVDRQTPAADVEAVIRRHAGGHLAHLALFDRYQGAPLEEGQVSLAYRLRFQPADEPIADAELDAAIGEVSQALAREVGGRIRSGA